MKTFGTVVATAVLGGAVIVGAGELLGRGDCLGGLIPPFELSACFPGGDKGGEEHIVAGPANLGARVLDEVVRMTFTEQAVTLSFPEDPISEKRTRVHWDGGVWGKDGDMEVTPAPFDVYYTPCTVIGRDYRRVDPGLTGNEAPTTTNGPVDPSKVLNDKESVFKIERVADENDPTKLGKIVVSGLKMDVCAPRIENPQLPVDTNGDGVYNDNELKINTNTILFSSTGEWVNNGTARTFQLSIRQMALLGGAAYACPEELLSMDDVKQQIRIYARGSNPDYASLPDDKIEVQYGAPAEGQQGRIDAFEALVNQWRNLEKTIFIDNDGDFHDYKITMPDRLQDLLQVTECK